MARVVSAMPSGSKYPWSVWSDGKTRIATKGDDFSCDVRSFVGAIFVYASRFGFKAKTRVVSGSQVKFSLKKLSSK
jgi:hypothetical protein